jgi:hypothetical protein
MRAKLIQRSFLAEKYGELKLISLSASLNIQNKKVTFVGTLSTKSLSHETPQVSNVAICNDGWMPALKSI